MNRGQAITRIKQTLGFAKNLDTIAGQMLDEAQEYMEQNWPFEPLPWFMLTEREMTSTTEEEERVEIPGDFIQEYEEDGMWLQLPEGGERLLTKYDLDDLRQANQERFGYNPDAQQTYDYPCSYALTGDYFRLFPKPLTVMTVKMIYYKKLALTVELTDENQWLKRAPYALIGWAGERLSAAKRDSNAFTVFQNWKQSGMEALQSRNIERKYANRRMAMGETL